MTFENYVKELFCTLMVIWSLFSIALLFIPSAAVLNIGETRHIAVICTEHNSTEVQKQLSNVVDRYTETSMLGSTHEK